MVRVPERQRYDITIERIDGARSANAKAHEIMSSQRKFNNISDDPLGVSRAIREKSKIEDLRQIKTNIEFAQGYLERSETALASIQDNLVRAKELSVAMANATNGPDSKRATAREIRELVNEVIALSNTTYGNRYVFSGFRTHTPTINQDGLFLGDDGAIFLQVDQDSMHQVNLQARELFEASAEERLNGHMGIIETLETLYSGLMEDDTEQLTKAIDALDHQMNKTTSFQARIGARSKAIEQALERVSFDEDLSRGTLSNIQDADIFTASSDFKRTENVLQTLLLASNKLLQPSLLNFMQ